MHRWIRRLAIAFALVFGIAAAAYWLLLVWPRRVAHPILQTVTGVLAIEHVGIYTAPGEPPIADGTVVMAGGRIVAVGAAVPIPPQAQVLTCGGCVVTAGFWNAHVHFTEPKWSLAEWKSRAELDSQLAVMLNSRGYTTVVDTGSNPSDTLAIRRRIESGELNGPLIYTSGPAIYPPDGVPYYIRDSVPAPLLYFFQPPSSPSEAVARVEQNLGWGSDITKIFSGSYIARGKVLPMPLAIARAAVEQTHAQGRLVFSHPSNLAGIQVAIESGVDVLAHAPDTTDGIGHEVIAELVRRRMALIPTLKLFGGMAKGVGEGPSAIYSIVRHFHESGGVLLFGTDTGYLSDYSNEAEFAALRACGLSHMEILAMLTTAPSARFGVSNNKGTVTVGKLADLTVLAADPAQDPEAFSKVRMTIRGGRVIYGKS